MLALVSEFNCFLRSRCSMEIWCPDDTGRDSWDWVGPPAWGRACFNSQEWGGGSSPVKTDPDCIVVVVVVVLSFRPDVYVHKRLGSTVQYQYRVTWEPRLPATPAPSPSPRALTGVSARGLQKIDYRFPSTTQEQPKHRLCISRQTAGNHGNTARGASMPAKPVWNMPLPLSTTSRPGQRIDLRSRVCPIT